MHNLACRSCDGRGLVVGVSVNSSLIFVKEEAKMAARRNLPPPPVPQGPPPVPQSPHPALIQDEKINVDILMPTGMLITLACYKQASLSDIKAGVWQEARNQPLFEMIKDQSFYSFFGKYCAVIFLSLILFNIRYHCC